MKTPIIYVTREELLTRRETILNKLGYTLKEWNRKYKLEEFHDEDWVYRDELDSIRFLLGEK